MEFGLKRTLLSVVPLDLGPQNLRIGAHSICQYGRKFYFKEIDRVLGEITGMDILEFLVLALRLLIVTRQQRRKYLYG